MSSLGTPELWASSTVLNLLVLAWLLTTSKLEADYFLFPSDRKSGQVVKHRDVMESVLSGQESSPPSRVVHRAGVPLCSSSSAAYYSHPNSARNFTCQFLFIKFSPIQSCKKAVVHRRTALSQHHHRKPPQPSDDEQCLLPRRQHQANPTSRKSSIANPISVKSLLDSSWSRTQTSLWFI